MFLLIKLILLLEGFLILWMGFIPETQAQSSTSLYTQDIVMQELARRAEQENKKISQRLSTMQLYLLQGDLLRAESIFNLTKSQLPYDSSERLLWSAVLDALKKNDDASVQKLQKIPKKDNYVSILSCALLLQLQWKHERFHEVEHDLISCGPVLAPYTIDDFFYTHLKQKFLQTELTVKNIVPSPFFYTYVPDHEKVSIWLKMLIAQKLEIIAIKHLEYIPEDMLKQNDIRLLTAIALFNAGDTELSLEYFNLVPNKDSLNAQIFMLAQSMNQHHLDAAWESTLKIFQQDATFVANTARLILLGWMKGETSYLTKIPRPTLHHAVSSNPLIAPILLAGLLAESAWSDFDYWMNDTEVRNNKANLPLLVAMDQYAKLQQGNIGDFYRLSEISCQYGLTIGCWPLLSSQGSKRPLTSNLYQHQSVSEYFQEVLQ